MSRCPRTGRADEFAQWKCLKSFMISTSYGHLCRIKAANRQIYLLMLRVDKFAYFAMLVNLSARIELCPSSHGKMQTNSLSATDSANSGSSPESGSYTEIRNGAGHQR